MRLTPNHMSVCVFQEVIGNSVKQAVCLPLYTIPERYSLFFLGFTKQIQSLNI